VNFTKKDRMVYISHLDLQRMLLRVLRMTGLKPAYTQGFHPHAKLSIALPLSLGYSSDDEYFEFEIDNPINTEAAIARLNEVLPDGIRVKRVFVKPNSVKSSLSALATGVTYEIMTIYTAQGVEVLDAEMISEAAFRWSGRDEIPIEKFNKKKNRMEHIDMRLSLLAFLPIKIWGNKVIFQLKLRVENGNVPNPATLFSDFLRFSEMETALNVLSVARSEIAIPGILEN
jgi:radical SAM-linked protein